MHVESGRQAAGSRVQQGLGARVPAVASVCSGFLQCGAGTSSQHSHLIKLHTRRERALGIDPKGFYCLFLHPCSVNFAVFDKFVQDHG
jgi:hypothetical protein